MPIWIKLTIDKSKTPVDLVDRSIQQTVNLGTPTFQMNYQMKAVRTVIAGAIATICLVLFVISTPGLVLFFIGGEILVLDWTYSRLSQRKLLRKQSWDQDLLAKKDRITIISPRHVNEGDWERNIQVLHIRKVTRLSKSTLKTGTSRPQVWITSYPEGW